MPNSAIIVAMAVWSDGIAATALPTSMSGPRSRRALCRPIVSQPREVIRETGSLR